MPFFDPIRIGASGAVDFTVDRSLRFNDGDSPNLARTPSGDGNKKKWTWSSWIKISANGTLQTLFSVRSGNRQSTIFLKANGQLQYFSEDSGGTTQANLKTDALLRDSSAWYHVVVHLDAANTTGKIYLNGVEQSLEVSTAVVNTDHNFNTTLEHLIGNEPSQSNYFDGYMAEINFVDGQALTPSSFGETNSTTGQWNPKDTSGLTFGTNGFRLQFADNSGTTATTLGKDTSGNSNNFTPNNFSVAAGENNDSVEDTPTNNWCTLNPLDADANGTFSEGNLKCVGSTGFMAGSNFVVTSGKWYMEVKYVSGTSNHQWSIGFSSPDRSYLRQVRGGDGELTPNTGTVAVTFADPDVIMVALDVDNGKWYIGKNGSYMLSGDPVNGTGFVHSGLSSSEGFMLCMINNTGDGSQTIAANFGQQGFTYTPPTDFKALNSANLPDPTNLLPNQYFDTLIYSGTGSSNSITGLNFAPDWVWVKRRNAAGNHHLLIDQIRGGDKSLSSNLIDAENSNANRSMTFNSNGVTWNSDTGNANASGGTYVLWNWNAGGSTASNSDGSITSSVRANTSAGFSIVSYTGTGSNATIGHGMGVAPSVIIIKARDRSDNWWVYHKGLSDPSTKAINLNLTNAEFTPTTSAFNPSAFTSSVFGVLTDGSSNASGEKYIAYCFNEVSSYSKFSSFTGNNNDDGEFVFLGFRPAFLVVRAINSAADWVIMDNTRSTSNPNRKLLYANTTSTEGDGIDDRSPDLIVDFLSNGFKCRATNNDLNNSEAYIYLSFAESPFKNARAV